MGLDLPGKIGGGNEPTKGFAGMSLGLKVRQELERYSLFFALLLVLLTTAFTYRAWSGLAHARQAAAVTRQVVDAANSLMAEITDAETAQRGFLLTGNERYLVPYHSAVAQVPASLASLARAAAARGAQHLPDQLPELRGLIDQKLAELAHTIDLRRAANFEGALAVVNENRGQALMEKIRKICTGIQSANEALIARQREDLTSRLLQAGIISVGGSVAVFLLLALATVTIRRAARDRQLLINNLVRSEQDARSAHALLQTTISSIGDGVITTDAAENIVFLNPVAESLTGWTQAEAAGKPLERIFVIQDENTGAPSSNPVTAALRENRIVNLANHTSLTTRDGRQVPIEDSAAPIRSALGDVTGVVLVFRDVTRRREAERARQKAAADLARHTELLEQTNAELQHFTYAASHDLREPLRTITAYTQLVQLRVGAQLDPKNQEFLQFIVAAALRMSRLIDALLEYSRAGEASKRPPEMVQMNDVAARVIANLHSSINENQAIVTYDSLPAVMAYSVHLEQILQNLIGNALKYRGQDIPRVHIAAAPDGDAWQFSVADNGQGIPLQYQKQIFELFKRLHGPQYAGAGIGLATCKRLVERYGGRIWVESEEGRGSTFFFTLPAAENASVTSAGDD